MRHLLIALVLAACSKGSGTQASSGSAAAAPGSYLTVGAYCSAFCDKLCGTCGAGDCKDACPLRCHYGRQPEKVLDGSDPKTGLALTQKDLDGCLAMITKDSCPAIASGQVPPACYTIQH